MAADGSIDGSFWTALASAGTAIGALWRTYTGHRKADQVSEELARFRVEVADTRATYTHVADVKREISEAVRDLKADLGTELRAINAKLDKMNDARSK